VNRTRTVRAPAVVGVPEMMPAAESLSPAGRVPAARLQVPRRDVVSDSLPVYARRRFAVSLAVTMPGALAGAGMNSSRFGEPSRSVTLPVVALATRKLRTCAGV
jgi:hypothetical protein